MTSVTDARRRKIFALVAEGRLAVEDAAVLLRARGAAASQGTGASRGMDEPLAIAVVGLAARFADAPDIEAYWDMLRAGRAAVSRMPSGRHPEAAALDRSGGFVPDADAFDPTFFRISPTEAALMDPQQRLFLEQAWLALEDAGLAGERASELRCGVYVGAGAGDYGEVLKAAGVHGNPLALMGNVPSILAARISYFLNLKGPNLAVDTACSSSLVGVHLAIEALERGEVEVALAGGVCVINTPEFMRAMAQGGMLSPSDACHTFDTAADGFACGEGAAAVVLKPLAAALADGDHIWGIIRGSGVNQDGRTNGITAPNGPSQEALQVEVYRRYGIDPRGISYIEAHGTGTPLGDPIEVDALTAAFRQFTTDTGFCRLGSVKTNIGHTLTAAGLAGFAKVLLQLRHETVAPSLHFDIANPRIDLGSSPFTVPTRTEPWPRVAGMPRRAAISSFGFSGTNAHLVVEEAPDLPPRSPAPGPFPIVLSARTHDALRRRAAAISMAVRGAPEMPLRDLSFTLASGRARLPVSAGFMAGDRAALLAGLDRIASAAEPASKIDLSGVNFAGARRVPLPGDPFDRVRIPPPRPALAPALATSAPATLDPAVLRTHGAVFAAAEDWGRAALVEAMRRLGLFDMGRGTFTRTWAHRRLGVIGARARLFDALIDMLARGGVCAIEGDVVRLANVPAPVDLEARRAAQPAAKPFLDLLAATTTGLPDVLTGRRTAMEVLFPGGRGDLVEAVYRGNPLADHLNFLLTKRVSILAEGRRKLRVLEVGAGTGGATRAVLAGLGPDVSYLFTDVARAFVGAARREFGGDRRVGFAVFDLEGPVAAEVAAAGPFDVVIASNVLHATRRIGDVLRCLHGVMAPGAALVLNEVTQAQDFATLTFGLTDGWWAFEDERLPGSPVLSVAGWRHALAAAGFPGVETDGLGGEDGVIIQAVLCATRDLTPAALVAPHSVLEPARVQGSGEYFRGDGKRAIDPPPSSPGVTPSSWPGVTPPSWPGVIPSSWPGVSGPPVAAGAGIGALTDVLARPDTPGHDEGETVAPEQYPSLHPNQPEIALERFLAEAVAGVLTMAPADIDRRARFMDYGLDSILGVALVEKLNAAFGIDLRPTVVFDHPTVADLGAHLATLVADHRRDQTPIPLVSPGKSEKAIQPDRRIAVIGLAARYADAGDLTAFRRMLREGRSGIGEVPPSRWRPDLGPDGQPDPFTRWGGFLANAEGFDPLALRISGKEAELTDPQHRVFLMEAWHALEDAGYGEAALDGMRCGVFVGAHGGDYTHRMVQAGIAPQAFAFMGNAASILAARIAYMLNLKGPAMAIDTACSSSLVAVHLACRSLLDDECDMALAGGVFVNTTKGFNIAAGTAGMLSPNGRCATFDAAADGFVPGEGTGVVVLKRLDRALADGDHVDAVIVATGINQDGKTNGITAPSPESQAALIRETYRRNGIDPRRIGYVEAHGTGTPLGDPIEIEGLSRAWADWSVPRGAAAIGSVKTNVGHAAHAAGIGGFIKAVLAVRDGEIHPSLHFRAENPKLRLGETPFRVPTTLEPWRSAPNQPRCAAVSSFGFSGTNCHIVIEEAAAVPRPEVASLPQLIVVSAKTATALARRMADLTGYLEGMEPRLDDLARTLAVGRTQFERRWATVAGTIAELRRALAGTPVSGSSDRLEALAARYRAGEPIDLDGIGAGGRRISVPTYPFELVPYWIDVKEKDPVTAEGNPASGNPAIVGEGDAPGPATLMAPRWRPAAVPASAVVTGALAVVGGTFGMVQALEAAWRAAGGDSVVAAIHPGAAAVVVLAGAATGEALLDAVRALLATKGSIVPVLVVHAGEPSDAALAAFGRSIAFFGGRAHVRTLEVAVIAPDSGSAIVRELALGAAGPREVRLANGERLQRVLEPMAAATAVLPLTDGAHCVITGGGGVLARVLAVRLTRRHGARIALVGRSVPNEAVVATIAAVESAGGKAAYWQVDVADSEQLSPALAAAETRFGPIAAVFHLAGVPGQGIVSEKRWDDMRAVMRAKAGGLTALDAAIGDRPLQLFVAFASLASELGDFGQCDYAAANAFADRFAVWREAQRQAGRRQGRTVSIDWPLWAEGRQVLSSEGAALFSAASGLRPLATGEALDLLDAAIASGEAQVAVFPTDADAARAMLAERVAEPARLTTAEAATGGGAEVVPMLVAMVAALMKLPAERLPVDANLADFGFDSIALKDFAVRISERWGVTVSPAAFFAHGTITRLADYLTAEHGIGGAAPPIPAPTKVVQGDWKRAVSPLPSSWPGHDGRGGAPTQTAPAPQKRGVSDDRAVAIVGMAGRFPGSPDVDAFWSHLESGHDLVGAMPEDRVAIAGRRGGRGGYLDDVDRFDHAFFGISVRDAQLMDPQHRLAVETTCNAFESAGINIADLAGRRIGVFFASQVNEYAAMVPFDETARAQMALGNIAALLPNRISWLFDFRGPSESVDTACSGSLVALHRAVLALRHGEAEIAVAGGVSLMLSPDAEETVKRLGVASSDGRCRVFDAGADGYVKGEGVAAVVLKPLAAALADGDPVLAVIRGSAVGHGGHAQTITAPDAVAEADVIVAAIADAGVPAASLGMIEAHGTGTQLGDPVEIEGLKTVFRRLGGGAPGTCAVGSVKSNIGHLEPAAGLAGLIKTVQALRHGLIPPTIHFNVPNPLIDLAGSPLRIADKAIAWPHSDDGTPRRAGVSSFGFGGAYAHVVLEEAPTVAALPPSTRPLLIVWSARSADRLSAVAARLAVAAREGEVVSTDLAWTLMAGRAALPHRAALVLRSDQDLGQRLDAAAAMLSGGIAASEVFAAGDGVALEPGEATDRLVRELIAAGRLGRVARLWVAGAAIDWAAAGVPRGRRVTLPGMPFAGPRLWFRGRPGATAIVATVPRDEPAKVVPVDSPRRAEAMLVDPPVTATPPVALGPMIGHGDALDHIRAMVAAALYVEADSIDVSAGLADLGLDSILAVELVREINTHFGTALQAARLYDHPTVEALATFVTGAAAQKPLSPMPSAPVSRKAVLDPQPRQPGGEVGATIHAAISRIVADALYVEPDALDETAGFGDLGLDSILAVEVVKAINDRFGVGLEAARLYDHPTLAALAAHVTSRLTVPPALAAQVTQPAPALGGRTTDMLDAVRAAVGAALNRAPESIDSTAPLASFAIGPEAAASILDRLASVAGFRPGLDAVGRCADLEALAVLLAAGSGPVLHPAAPPVPRPAARPLPVAPASSPMSGGDLVGEIRREVAEVLAVAFDDVDPDVPLATLGVDLVQAGEIAYRLNRVHGGGLKARALLEAGTIRTLADRTRQGVQGDPNPGVAARTLEPARATLRPPDIARSEAAGGGRDTTRAVAVIGLACRFPGASDAAEFWRNLAGGVCSVVEIPPDRWPAGLHDGVLTDDRQRAAVRWGGFIDDVDRFDPLFFGISPKEAEFMDPQQRLFLQEAWHAMEDAGLTRDALRGSSCGVFVGAGQGDYVHLLPRDGAGLSGQMLLGNTTSILAARIAYFLDLKGPSLALDTACSSALVAVHYAARSIRDGECDLALAGGVSLMLTPQMHLMTAASGMLAADGRCKTFDDGADGFVPGEGVGVVVLKRLDQALADGDRVYGVIAGSAVNQDGRTSSITAPSAASQARLEGGLYRSAGIDAERIGYVEAHGTGTRLGDPIEISALTEAFAAAGATGPCAIGSVKTNIGHTLAAAGSAGLIKTLLAMHHATVPPSLFFARANAHIRFEDTPFRVQTAPAAWPADRPLAAVSSFGFSGTNAHIVVAPPPSRAASGEAALTVWPIVLSAPSEPALRRWAGVLADMLGNAGGPSIRDLAHTLARRRTAFKARAVLVAADVAPLVPMLRALADGAAPPIGDLALPASLAAAARAFALGQTVDWSDLPRGHIVSLPGYPFERRRFWIELPVQTDRTAPSWAGVPVRPDVSPSSLPGVSPSSGPGFSPSSWPGVSPSSGPDFSPSSGPGVSGPPLAVSAGIGGPDTPGPDDGVRARAGHDEGVRARAGHDEGVRARSGHDEGVRARSGHDEGVRARSGHDEGVRAQSGHDEGAWPGQDSTHSETALVIRRGDAVIAGHLVGGQPLLPGAASLLLAARHAGQGWVEVSGLAWLARIEVTGERRLIARRDSTGTFTLTDRDSGAPLVRASIRIGTLPTERLDPSALAAALPMLVPADAVYRFLRAAGIAYGPSFHRVESVRVGAGRALVQLRPAGRTADPFDADAVGHLDAALHALAAFSVAEGGSATLMMPAAIDRALIGPAAVTAVWAMITSRSTGAGGTLAADIVLAAADGSVLARIDGLRAAVPAQGPRTFVLAPEWAPAASPGNAVDARPIAVLHGPEAAGWAGSLVAAAEASGRKATAAGSDTPLADAVGDAGTVVFCGWGAGQAEDGLAAVADAENAGVVRLLALARYLIATGRPRRLLVLTRGAQAVGPDDRVLPGYAALSGFARTLAREHPALDPVVVDLPTMDAESRDAARRHFGMLLAEPGTPDNVDIAYRDGRRFARRFAMLALPDTAGDRIRTAGVYLVIGGAGGIGRALSLDLARRHGVRLAWVGRRAADDAIAEAIAAVEVSGGSARYYKADARVPADLAGVVRAVEAEWGAIHGVIHAAIVLADCRIEAMEEVTLAAALHAKSRVAAALAVALKGRTPDFLAVFSSSNAFTCNPGQANYAAGCTFLDAWAVAWGKASGIPALVIDWGFWGETGIVASDEYRQRAVAAGVDPMTTEEGLDLFRRLLGAGVTQAVVMRFAAAGRAKVEAEMARRLTRAAEVTTGDAIAAARALSVPAGEPDAALHVAAAEIEAIEDYARRRLLHAFGEGGLLIPGRHAVDTLAQRAAVVPGYRRLFEALLDMLARSGALKLRDGVAEIDALPAEAMPARPVVSRLAAHLDLLDACLGGLADVLSGRRSYVEVMFPGGSAHLVEAVYRDNPSSDVYNAILADAGEAFAKGATGPLQVLEMGAGTGGATVGLVAALGRTGSAFTYTYTDVSPRFLEHGRRLFPGRSDLHYALLDIDADPVSQGFAAGGFDLIVASNVLHAGRDLAAVVDHAKRLLKRDGVLLLNEMTARSDLATLTFGLTEGWWAFGDQGVRLPHAPLLDGDGWRGALWRAGFHDATVGGPGGGQSVVLAVSDGWLPERRAASSAGVAVDPVRGEAKIEPGAATAPADKGAVAAWLTGVFAEALKLEPDEIDPGESYDRYGVDSLVAMDIRARLEKSIGPLATPMLFEGVSLDGLAEMLMREKPAEIAAVLGHSQPDWQHPSPPQPSGRGASGPPVAAGAGIGAFTRVLARPDTPSHDEGAQSGHDSNQPEATLAMPALAVSGQGMPARHAVIGREPIAIVGLSGRYPGGADSRAFWHTLSTGASAVAVVPASRGDWQGAGAGRAALIDDVDRFDPLFFQIAPAEAAAMDPQERLFLEVAWEAIEDAGTTPRRLGGPARRVGVFAGAMRSDYQRYGTIDFARGGPGLAGSASWSIANRLSFLLDFRGPSMAIDTACSASLVAIRMACEHLIAGRIDAAVAGGAHLILHPQSQVAMARMGLLSPTGNGRPFAADADGFVEGEGVGAVVLKRLSDAERDGDRIRAVILGGGVNSSGRTSGYMIPNLAAEAELMEIALADSGVTAADIDYVEAQASGSRLGDPVEFAALSRAFRAAPGKRPLGSLKGTIGHLSAASGVAQLTKVVLQLEHSRIAPMAVPPRTSAEIDLDASPFRFAGDEPWSARAGRPRIATVSAYGAGGANAMLVVAEAPSPPVRHTAMHAGGHIVVISARTSERLRMAGERLARYLETEPGLDLTAVAWTLQTGREAMAYRLALVADDLADVVAGIGDFLADRPGAWRQGKANGHASDGLEGDASAEAVAEAWAKGAPIDWMRLWHGTPPRPVSLPTYPFERRRCWIDMTAEPAPTIVAAPEEIPAPPSTRRAVVISRPADIDAVAIAELPLDPPAAGEIEIAVAAFALNFGDLLSLRGAYPNMPPYPFVPGFEAAGHVAALGAGVTAFAIGDPVVALTGGRGGHADRVVVPAGHAIRLPEGYDLIQAAAFPIGWLTARHALDRASVAAGETVLVTSAGGGVGPFVVQLALAANARVLATAGSAAKLDALRHLGAEALNYRTDDVASWVRAETAGRGADVVVNLLGGDAVQQGIDLLAPSGRYIEIALSGLMSAGRLDLSRFLDNQSFIAVNLGRVLAGTANTRAEFAGMAAAMAAGTIRPLIDAVLPFSEIEEAYGRLARRENVGKVVVAVDAAVIPSSWPGVSGPPVLSSWPGVSGPPIAAGAGIGGPDKPGHDERVERRHDESVERRHDESVESGHAEGVEQDHAEGVDRSDGTLAQLTHVVAGVLGLGAAEIAPDRPLDELGLTSVTGLEIARRIESVAGRPVPVTLLWKHRTLARLAVALASPAVQPRPVARSPLVTIRATGTTAPLFLVHGAPGEVSWVVDLAQKLGDDVPVHAFEAPGLNGDAPVPETVDAFATIYAGLLMTACPSGPYWLGGYSGGGAIAFAVARIMAERGRPATGLLLLDANAPGNRSLAGMDQGLGEGFIYRLAGNWLARRWDRPMLSPDALAGLSDAQRAKRVLDHLYAGTPPPMPRQEADRLIVGMDRVARVIGRALADYRTVPIAPPIRTVLFRCTHGMAPADNPLDLPAFLTDGDYRAGWDLLVGGPLEVHAIECDHFSLVLEPHASRLAAAIRPMLRAGQPSTCSREHVARVVLDQVRHGLPDVPPAEIRPERSMTELGATSIDRVEVTLAAMEALGADIPPRDLAGLANIDALIDVLHRHIGERRAP